MAAFRIDAKMPGYQRIVLDVWVKAMNNRFLASLSLVAFLACCQTSCVHTADTEGAPKNSRTISKTAQGAITPDQSLARLKEGNQRFVSGNRTYWDHPARVKATAAGQYPFAVVLSCMDSRSSPEIVFDQGIGDLFVIRIAGNFATTPIIGSMEYATKVAGAKLVVVMGHSQCGAIKGACDNIELGNLTDVIQALRPAVEEVKDVQEDRSSHNKRFVQLVAEANVRRTVAKIRADSPILREMEQAGQIKIIGAMNDISTGEVKFFD